jgi:hypothetical protein
VRKFLLSLILFLPLLCFGQTTVHEVTVENSGTKTFPLLNFSALVDTTPNPALSGAIRLANSSSITGRNFTNTTDIPIGSINTSNQDVLGGSAGILLSGPIAGATTINASGQVTASGGIAAGGASMFKTSTSANTDIDGELSFSAATTATYSWINSYVSHPECTIEPQFDFGTAHHWVTYTGVTSFTINFSSAVTGSVSYLCGGRN